MELYIKDAASAAGVSVRTLHYWDSIGLLKPLKTTENGYRLYSESDLEKLQQVLFFKELDFSLSEIKEIIDNPDFDKLHGFNLHRRLLLKKRERLDSIITALDNSIKAMEENTAMSNEDRFNAFDMSEIETLRNKYASEVKEKYGSTDAYRESSLKTSNYDSNDWERITTKGNEILKKIGEMTELPADSPEVMLAVERWQNHISANYYNCTAEILKGLGEMYISDERFKKNIDKIKPGLAQFLSEAVKAYCSR